MVRFPHNISYYKNFIVTGIIKGPIFVNTLFGSIRGISTYLDHLQWLHSLTKIVDQHQRILQQTRKTTTIYEDK